MRGIQRILGANYEKADLNTVMDQQCQYLNTEEYYGLLNLLRKSEYVFNGTLGTWENIPVYLELKDNANPVCS